MERAMEFTRRQFLTYAAAAAAATEIDGATGMPMRPLGSTGEKVSLLAFGAGSRWLMYKSEDRALEALHRALQAGINYVDSAASYGDGQSERWIGQYLRSHRKNFFLVTKLGGDRTYSGTMKLLERSLRNLSVSQVDLLHIHSLGSQEDLSRIEAPEGQLKAMLRAKEEKMTRFIGVTCHTDPAVLKTALERHPFDSVQMALNIAQIGAARPSDRAGEGMTGPSGFEAVALPVALKKKIGLTAMKVFAQEKLLGQAPPEILLRYAMTLPVSACVVGMPSLENIDFNVNVAKNFRPLSENEMKELPRKVSAALRASIERFFAGHVDA